MSEPTKTNSAPAPTQPIDQKKAMELAKVVLGLSEIKQAYINSIVDSMLAGNSGSVTEKIERHLAGERVTTEYVNMETGKSIHVPMDEPLPKHCYPVLGDVS